ncbi:hypothetical protein [Halorhabdus sp. CUG00001]|uniref:hypothetical protein n=1 Tax=Halorhabdus sp. CUG00001 TaxID=2600297 RepID=UPI00131B8114|nr:hypothetical protein [Halorhabdus sp. CUG00001]
MSGTLPDDAEIIDDLVVLGRAGPELIEKDGRHTVCLGGWSESKGFVRLYPTHKYSNAKRWNVIKVPVIKDPDDYRDESWKIVGSKEDWDHLHEKIEKVDELSRPEAIELTKKIPKTCRHIINNREQSLGLVEPEIENVYLNPIEDPEPIHTDLEGNRLKSKGAYQQKLYVEYTCKDVCEAKTGHDQHCIEWGMYRFWDNHPDRDPEEVIDALHLRDDDYKKFFFIGNQKNHPTSYIIISVIRWKKDKMFQKRISDW